MGRKELPSVINAVRINRLKETVRKDSIAAAGPAIRASRTIIEKLFQGRDVESSVTSEFSHLYLTIDPHKKDAIHVEIIRHNLETPEYSLEIDNFDFVPTLNSDYGFIQKKPNKEDKTQKRKKAINFSRANQILHFLGIVEIGVTLNGVEIRNPLIEKTPQPETALPF